MSLLPVSCLCHQVSNLHVLWWCSLSVIRQANSSFSHVQNFRSLYGMYSCRQHIQISSHILHSLDYYLYILESSLACVGAPILLENLAIVPFPYYQATSLYMSFQKAQSNTGQYLPILHAFFGFTAGTWLRSFASSYLLLPDRQHTIPTFWYDFRAPSGTVQSNLSSLDVIFPRVLPEDNLLKRVSQPPTAVLSLSLSSDLRCAG